MASCSSHCLAVCSSGLMALANVHGLGLPVRPLSKYSKKASGLNFSRTFISSISLLSDLASSNLLQTLLDLWQVLLRQSYFCEICLHKPKRAVLLIKPFSYNHSISDVSAFLNNTRQTDFVKSQSQNHQFLLKI